MDDLKFRKQVLDSISDSFCGAKWYNATIWLGSGMTTSCHHPPAHKVSVEEVQKNFRALHNTSQKRDDRANIQWVVSIVGRLKIWGEMQSAIECIRARSIL